MNVLLEVSRLFSLSIIEESSQERWGFPEEWNRYLMGLLAQESWSPVIKWSIPCQHDNRVKTQDYSWLNSAACNKTGRWPALFLTFPLHLWRSLHYFTLLCITLHYLGHFSLLYSTCVRFMVAGGDLFVTPPLWHPASVAVQTLS